MSLTRCSMLKILDPHGKEAKLAMAAFTNLDVYWRPEYLLLSECAREGKGHLVLYEGEKGRVLYPFLLREVSFSVGGKRYFDITSPYGYGGPLYEPKDPGLAQEFSGLFHSYCVENGIVAEFIRFFHPVLANHEVFQPADALVPRGQVAVLELEKSADQLAEELSPKVKRNLKSSERAGVEIVFDEGLEQLEEFVRLYRDTMERRGAEERYLFEKAYFNFVKAELSPFAFLVAAKQGGKVIAAALFFGAGPYMAYHLAASDFRFRAFCANELIVWRTALWGKEQGFQFLNLGGGVGGAEDSLFQFKSSFTPARRPAFLGKVIHDQEAYQKLTKDWEARSGRLAAQTSFFPAYRAS